MFKKIKELYNYEVYIFTIPFRVVPFTLIFLASLLVGFIAELLGVTPTEENAVYILYGQLIFIGAALNVIYLVTIVKFCVKLTKARFQKTTES
jgi:hypothetical protein